MRKLLLSISVLSLLLSCDVDPVEDVTASDLTTHITQREIPTYKGVFTTMNSEYRATVHILFPNEDSFSANTIASNYPRAIFKLHNGEIYTAYASERVEPNTTVKNLEFSSNDLRFTFSVEADGSEPTVSNVVFKNMESSVLVAKHTRQAPVTPITGTYNCINCNGHPNLDAGRVQTFNMMFTTADGESAVTTQSLLGTTQYNGIGYQDNCVATGNFTNCEINSGDGSTTTVGYLANGNPVYWSGTHNFNNEAPGANDCSGAWGTWSWQSNSYGVLTGQFESDPLVDCYTELLFEDFEDATVLYTTSVPEFTDNGTDYFIRTNGSNIGGSVSFSNIQGSSFFAAQDLDGDGAAPLQYVTFENIMISAYSSIQVSTYFAEDDDGSNEDWDAANDYVKIEYSYDGTTWTPVFAIENDGTTFNTAPQIDTDLDGIGDGTEITDTFIKYRAGFMNNGVTNPTASSTVSVRFAIYLDSGDEDIAIDNVLIEGQ
ncbi:hypothetical protein [Altibacter sp.]|uniref:hypothetical protein n=1 Tax=Altibacter sp. TaxID=2024823 RepID=UPI000C92E72C|nr:hypothetical protein [Altibacter sp.]MAP53367.1 hypothetical protein [Altibacter sp.]